MLGDLTFSMPDGDEWVLFGIGVALLVIGAVLEIWRTKIAETIAEAKRKREEKKKQEQEQQGGVSTASIVVDPGVIGAIAQAIIGLIKKGHLGAVLVLVGLLCMFVATASNDNTSKLTVAKANARVTNGEAAVQLKCEGKKGCEGSGALVASGIQIAARNVRVRPGGTVPVLFKLNAPGLRQLARGDISATVNVAGEQIGSVTVLRPATLLLTSRTARARAGRVPLTFGCEGHGRCAAAVRLAAGDGTVATGRVTVPEGETRPVTFTLNDAARQRLRNRGRLRATVIAGTVQLGTVTVTRSGS